MSCGMVDFQTLNLYFRTRSNTARCQCHNTAVPVLYELSAELQLDEYRIVCMSGRISTQIWIEVWNRRNAYITVFGGNRLQVQLPYNKTWKCHQESQIRKVTQMGRGVNNKPDWEQWNLKGQLNSQHPPPSLAPSFTLKSVTAHRLTRVADKHNSNMDALINWTCLHRVAEFANNWKWPCHLGVNREVRNYLVRSNSGCLSYRSGRGQCSGEGCI